MMTTDVRLPTANLVAICRYLRSAEQRVERCLQALEGAADRAGAINPAMQDLDTTALLEQAVNRFAAVSEARFDSEVVGPLVRRALPAIDLLGDAAAESRSQERQALLGAQCELLELLAGYGVKPLRARQGSAFNPRWMRPEQVRLANDQRQHMTVAAMTRLGFRREQRVLRPAFVVILKYKETSNHDRSN